MQENHPARSLRHQEECEYCTSSTTGRGTGRERCKNSASIIGGIGRSGHPGSLREPGLREVVGDYRSGEHEVTLRFYKKIMTVDEHEYHIVMTEDEAKIRTFRQLELEACLEELNCMIRCHNCEALNCPQEEYPARPLPTPPPSYIDNLQNILIKVQREYFQHLS